MEIYTIQHPAVLDELERNGYYRPDPSNCLDNTDPYFGYRICYRWMIDELKKKCGLPYNIEENLYKKLKNEDNALMTAGWHMSAHPDGGFPCLIMPPSPMPHPVWGWQKTYGRTDGKPDMRSWMTAEPEQVTRLKLDIPEKRLLFSDFEHWHIPLNMGYFPHADNFEDWQEQDDKFDEKCRAAGLGSALDLFSEKFDHVIGLEENPLIHELQQELLASWKNCIVAPDNLGSVDDPIPFIEVEWTERETQCVFWEIMADDVRKVEHFVTRKAGKI